MRAFVPLFLILLALIFTGCATGGSHNRSGSNTLTAEEIGELEVQTAYDAVQIARPQWLVTRGSGTMENPNPQTPVVYLDGVRMGNAGELSRIWITVVEKMEYLSPSDATNRFGTNHTGGAILVTTR